MAAHVSLSKADSVSVSNDLSTSVVAFSSLAVSKGDPGYFGDLSPLFLESGGQLLPAGDHGRFVLDWAGSGPDAAAARVILADSRSLFPLVTCVVAQGGEPVSLHVRDREARTAKLTLDLCRNLMAAPTADLAIDLVGAMNLNDGRTDVDRLLSDFFASHPPFAGLSIDLLSLMFGWMRQCAYLWGMDDAGGLGRRYDLVPAPYYGVTTRTLGTLELMPRAGNAEAGPANRDSGLAIAFMPMDGDPVALRLSDGSLSDGAGGRLVLTGGFADPVWLAPSVTNESLSPVFVGLLDGRRVLALPAGGKVHPPASRAVGPTGAAQAAEAKDRDGLDYAGIAFGFVGLVSSLITIVQGVSAFCGYKRARKAQQLPFDRTEIGRALKRAEDQRSALEREMQALAELLGSQPQPIGRNELQKAMRDFRKEVVETLHEVAQAQTEMVLRDIKAQVQQLASIEVINQIQDTQKKMLEAQSTFEKDLAVRIEKLSEAISTIPPAIESLGNQLTKNLADSIKEALRSNRELVQNSSTIIEDSVPEFESGENGIGENVSPIE